MIVFHEKLWWRVQRNWFSRELEIVKAMEHYLILLLRIYNLYKSTDASQVASASWDTPSGFGQAFSQKLDSGPILKAYDSITTYIQNFYQYFRETGGLIHS